MLDAATPGPWQWFGNTKVHSLYLATVHHGRRFVMRFARWGMQGAQPRFQVDGRMVDGSTLVQYERTYRADVDGINHPDARLIEQAPTLIRELLAALEEAEQFGRLSAIAINQLSADLENMSGRKVLTGDPLPDKID